MSISFTGFSRVSSSTRWSRWTSTVWCEALKNAGVWIKNRNGSSSALDDCLRVTVGTEQENAAFLTALRAAL